MIKKSFMLLFLLVCSTSLFSQDVEQELALLQDIFGECLEESTADDFADIDELYMFVELNCSESTDPWGGDTTNWEISVEDELVWMQDYYGECLEGYTAEDFATVDELYLFVNENCDEDIVICWIPTLEEEFMWMQDYYGECLEGYTADDFENLDELWLFVEANCEEPEPWMPSVEEELGWMQVYYGECLEGYTADDFATVDDLYVFINTNCEDNPWIDDTTNWEISVEEELVWMQDYYGECLEGYTADDFENVDELWLFVDTNCEEPEPWMPSVEEEFGWMQEEFGECLADYTADDFENVDELYIFIELNCFDNPWIDDTTNWEISVEDELIWMQDYYGECLEGYTADDFENVDELWLFVDTNCEEPEPWMPSVEEEFGWMQEEFGECLADYTADDFENVDELYIFIELNCFDNPWIDDTTNWEISVEEEFAWMQQEFGECLANYAAADFATIDELYAFVEENCLEGQGEDEDSELPADANNSASNNNTTIGLDKINNGVNMSNALLVLQESDLSNISLVLIDNRGKIIEELELEETIKVYPNPTTDFINVDVRELGVETVQLYDLKGSLVRDVTISVINGVYPLDVSDLATNMYVLQMTTAKGVVVERIQIIR